MSLSTSSSVPEILEKHESDLLADWLRELKASGPS